MSIRNLIQTDNYYHLFQPIYDISTWTVIGYEGLLRTNLFSSPDITFREAKKEKQLFELDSGSIQKAAYTYQTAGFSRREGFLFLNVFPSTILNTNFPTFLKGIMNDEQVQCQQLVFEINELEQVLDFDTFQKHINLIKEQGFQIALDDFGKGFTDFKTIIEIKPNYIKLDNYFSKELHTSKEKQTLIEMFVKYCSIFNGNIILEGLENAMDLAIAKSLGVNFAQGYILGKPQSL